MNRVAGVMKIHTKDKWSLYLISSIVLGSSFIVNLITAMVTGGKEPIYTGGVASIYVYMFVAGIIVLAQMFPFALGLSVRRTDFYLGTAFMIGVINAVTALVLLLFAFIEQKTEGWGVNLHFFHLPYLNDGTIIEQFVIFFIILLHMSFLGFLIASVYQRLPP